MLLFKVGLLTLINMDSFIFLAKLLRYLRCIHKELVAVSIRLKTTIRTEKARKIFKTAEKQLLQARINLSTVSLTTMLNKGSYVGQS